MSEATLSSGPPPAPRSRWMRIALIASLALNLMILGALAGAAWRFRSPSVANLQFGPANIMSYLSDLPSERRAVIWSDTAELRRQLGPSRRATRVARRELNGVMRSDPFDQAGFLEAQTKLIEAERLQRIQAAKLFASVAGKLTPDERRNFMQWREKRLPAGQKRDEQDVEPEQAPAQGKAP
jgi:uncharacterized membrane protein